MSPLQIVALCGAGILLIALGYGLRYVHARIRRSSLEIRLKERELHAEERSIELIEAANAKAERILHDAESHIEKQEEKLSHKEERLDKKEELLDERQITLDSEREHVRTKIEEVKALRDQLKAREASVNAEYERIAGLSREEAYEELVADIEATRAADITTRIQKLTRAGEAQFTDVARDLLLTAMHRVGNSLPTSVMTANIELPSDDVKAKIIGREGRNVRAFERATGVDVLVDDTPGYVVLSSFDPVRREIARVALEKLISDGRIQPARIEETVAEATAKVAETINEMGDRAMHEAGVAHLHPDLVKILGRLHFRTSYGQNVLSHSVEMAHIAGMLAEEIGVNADVARAGALLHDIGKALDHEVQGSHVEIGIRILKKYGVSDEVILAMRPHHEEYPYETPESILVQVADAISGSRPGARRDSVERYIQRLAELESIAQNLAGVERAFAISAGREIRVLVNPEQLSELQTHELARTIATTIEGTLRYPGEIKVHVIRETTVVSYAR